jgi:hypothetical protein
VIPKNRIYQKVGKGQYAIVIPVAFTRKDVRSKNWDRIQDSMAQNVINLLADGFTEVTKDIQNKK